MRVEHLETAVLSLLPQSIQGLDDRAVEHSSMGDMRESWAAFTYAHEMGR
jgi:hypothetical protein